MKEEIVTLDDGLRILIVGEVNILYIKLFEEICH